MSKLYAIQAGNENAKWTEQPFGMVQIPDPNALGSTSNPFDSTTTRNAAAPFPAGSTPSVVGSPVNTMYQLRSDATQAGAIDADWQVFGAGGATTYGLSIMGSSTGADNGSPGIAETMVSSSGWSSSPVGSANGPIAWAYALTRCSLPILQNVCVGGTTIGAQAAQFEDLRAVKPSHTMFFCGSNDLHGSATLADIWPTIKGWIEEVIAWGGKPIIYIPHIRTNQPVYFSKLLAYRRAVIDLCYQLTTSGSPAFYIDSLSVVADPESATLSPKTGYIDTVGSTGVHLTNMGAQAVGIEAAKLFDSLAPRRMPHTPLLGYDQSTAIPEKLINPRLNGVGGSLPTSWIGSVVLGSPTATYQTITTPNGHKKLRVTINWAANGDGWQLSQDITSAGSRLPNGGWGSTGVTIVVVSGAQYLASAQLKLALGGGVYAQSLARVASVANRVPWTLVEGKPIYMDVTRFLVANPGNGDLQWSLYFNGYAAGATVIDIEAPYVEKSQYPWIE